MEIKNYIEESLKKLNLLGIDTLDEDDKIISNILKMPKDMLDDLSRSQILGLVLDYIGISEYNIEKNEYKLSSNDVYSFDMEVADIDIMYTIFLNYINKISNEELKISNIVEDTTNVNFEEGTGTQIVKFKVYDKEYKYEAKVNHDWFDTRIISYINQILQEQNSNKFLYVTSDGWQNCILFYKTEKWAEKYNQAFPDLQIEK